MTSKASELYPLTKDGRTLAKESKKPDIEKDKEMSLKEKHAEWFLWILLGGRAKKQMKQVPRCLICPTQEPVLSQVSCPSDPRVDSILAVAIGVPAYLFSTDQGTQLKQ